MTWKFRISLRNISRFTFFLATLIAKDAESPKIDTVKNWHRITKITPFLQIQKIVNCIKISSPKEERCDLILWSFGCFRWIDFCPRRAFYGQENCNLSLYKSTRISLTNAILYSQSPVYLQQLRRLERGRILNFTAHNVYTWKFIQEKSLMI